MRLRSFQAKLILLMLGVLVLLQAAMLAALHVAGQRTIRSNVAEELEIAHRVLERVLETRGRRLSDSVRILAADFAFREAVASGHQPTIVSVLQNHGSRIDADSALLVSLEGQVVADTVDGRLSAKPFLLPSMIEEARATGEAAAIISLHNRPHQLVLVPVMAPREIAWVGMGFELDETVLAEVRRLTSVDISLFSPGVEGRPTVLSTLSARKLGDLPGRPPSGRRVEPMTLDGEAFLSLSMPIETADDSGFVATLQRSLVAARGPYVRLELQILGVSSLALLVAALASILLARGVSRPLKKLAAEAGRIARGDYSAAVDIRQRDEIGQLAVSFNEMRGAISERENQIRHQATHDELTGLPNRTLFLDRLDHAIAAARRSGSLVGIIMMDLDRFKEINDALGHHFGDEVLTEVGNRLGEALRQSDTVARLGGDEFAVTFFAETPARCEEIAQRIGDALSLPLAVGGVSIEVRASMGIALYPVHAGDAQTLMKRADVAMYDSKQNHTHHSVYQPGRDEHSLKRLAILSELRNAVASGQLQLHFQPKVDVSTRKATSVEALVRWQHPVHGLLSPAEFIPLAEQSGNIALITQWVLKAAIDQCSAWHADGLDVAVAVNLSALDLFDAGLPAAVKGRLKDAGLSPSKLAFEITESAVMQDPVQAMKVLGELKRHGVSIAIDDYGTGYSSLSNLKRLPADELKIDKSFVLSLKDLDSEDGVIVRSTIDLGHRMGLRVVAEGVETADAWSILERLGCDTAQGFYISAPLPASEVIGWMAGSDWN